MQMLTRRSHDVLQSSIPPGDIADQLPEGVENIAHPSPQEHGGAGNPRWYGGYGPRAPHFQCPETCSGHDCHNDDLLFPVSSLEDNQKLRHLMPPGKTHSITPSDCSGEEFGVSPDKPARPSSLVLERDLDLDVDCDQDHPVPP